MKESILKKTLIISTSLFLLIFALSPFIWMIVVAFSQNINFMLDGNYQFTLQNFINIISQESLHFPDYFKNSLIVCLFTALIVSIISSFAAYAVSRLRFPGRIIIPLAVLAMSMFPQISIVGYLYKIFSAFALTDSYISLVLPYTAWTIPIALWINISYFNQVPPELDKASLVDGAGRVKTLLKIIMPLALPGIFSSFLLVFIAAFNEFLFAILLTSTPQAQTLPVGIALFQGMHGEVPWGNIMAASALAAIPLVIMTLIFQRYIVRGLMGGALKG